MPVNTQATGVLLSEGYKPPVTAMTVVSGIGGIVASFFGGHNANVAGPMTAIVGCYCKEKNYVLCLSVTLDFSGEALTKAAIMEFSKKFRI